MVSFRESHGACDQCARESADVQSPETGGHTPGGRAGGEPAHTVLAFV
jgi:hypothetical protein